MAVIPYVQVDPEAFPADTQVSAAIAARVNENVSAVAGLQVSGCVASPDAASVDRYYTRPSDWLTVAWCVLYSDGGAGVDAEALVDVAFSFASSLPGVSLRLAVRGVPGPAVSVASLSGPQRIQLSMPGGVGTGWMVVELQIQSELGVIEDTRSIAGSDADDVIHVGGSSITKVGRLLRLPDLGTDYIGVEDLGGNRTRIWPAERAEKTGDCEIYYLGAVKVLAFRATLEGRVADVATPPAGSLLSRVWSGEVSRQVSRIWGQTQRSGLAGTPAGTVASRRNQLVQAAGGSELTIGALLLEEHDSLEVVVLFGATQSGSYRCRLISLDTTEVYADTSVVVEPGASRYYEDDEGSLAAWQLAEGRTAGLGWAGPGELGRALRGDQTTGLRFVRLVADGPLDWQSGLVTLTIEGPAGAIIGVWAVGARTIRPGLTWGSPPQGALIDEAEVKRNVLLTDRPYLELRRDAFAWSGADTGGALAALHRASPLPIPIGWGVDAVGANCDVLVEWYDDTDTLAHSHTLTLGAAGYYSATRPEELVGDERYRIAVTVTGAGDVSAIRVYERPKDPEPEVITFGSASADFLTYADLPSDSPEGSWAVDVRTPGATYRAHEKFGRTWWIPSVAYGDGTGFVLLAACDGSEADAVALGARGLTPAQSGTGAVTYQPGGAQVIRLATTVGAGSAALSTADYAGAPTNYDSDTDTWIVLQRENVGGVAAGFARIALATQSWQVRYGRKMSAPTQDRLFRDSNIDLNATTNYLSGVTQFSADADTDTVELIRRTQPAGTVGAGGDRVETRRSGDGYLSVIGPTQGGGAAWLAFAGAQSGVGSAASMDVRTFLVVVRP